MNNLITNVAPLCWLAAILAAVQVFSAPTQAVTLQDFGYQHININGQLSLGHRPMVVILANFGARVPITHSAAYYDSLIFDITHPLTARSLNSFFLETSNGRFFWSRGAVIGPFQFPESQSFTNYPGGERGPGFYSNVVAQVMMSGFDFKQYDANNDNIVTQDELQIMIITDNYDTYGTVGGRPAGTVQPPGFAYSIQNNDVSTLFDGNSGVIGAVEFFIFCHESSHTVGTVDVYGYGANACQSKWLTTMGCQWFDTLVDRTA